LNIHCLAPKASSAHIAHVSPLFNRTGTGVGRAIKVKGCSGAMAVTRVLRSQVRSGLAAGGKWIRTIGPAFRISPKVGGGHREAASVAAVRPSRRGPATGVTGDRSEVQIALPCGLVRPRSRNKGTASLVPRNMPVRFTAQTRCQRYGSRNLRLKPAPNFTSRATMSQAR